MDKASKPFTIISGLNYYADPKVAEQFRESLTEAERQKITTELNSLPVPDDIDSIEGTYAFDVSPVRGIIIDYNLKVGNTSLKNRIAEIAKVEILGESKNLDSPNRRLEGGKSSEVPSRGAVRHWKVVFFFSAIAYGVIKFARTQLLGNLVWLFENLECALKKLMQLLKKLESFFDFQLHGPSHSPSF